MLLAIAVKTLVASFEFYRPYEWDHHHLCANPRVYVCVCMSIITTVPGIISMGQLLSRMFTTGNETTPLSVNADILSNKLHVTKQENNKNK